MLTVKPYTSDQTLVSAKDNYEGSFAMVDAQPNMVSTILHDILTRRNPRVYPAPPETIIKAIQSALFVPSSADSKVKKLDGLSVMETQILSAAPSH